MNAAMTAKVDRLVSQVERLRSLHRNGEAPQWGQVDALFDAASDVRRALDEEADDAAALRLGAPAPPPGRPMDLAHLHLAAASQLIAAHVDAMQAGRGVR
jgi:hypothetical protein